MAHLRCGIEKNMSVHVMRVCFLQRSLHVVFQHNTRSNSSATFAEVFWHFNNVPYLQGPIKDVYQAALGLGTANQLTNILRDVGEDATERNRIYVPTQELKEFGISESEVSCSSMQDQQHAACQAVCPTSLVSWISGLFIFHRTLLQFCSNACRAATAARHS